MRRYSSVRMAFGEARLNWEIIGATGEWAGALAVVVTLFYLARQIRQNTKATKTGASYAVNESLSRLVGALRADGELADIWLRGCQDIELLNDVEHVRFTSHVLDMLNLAEYAYQLEKQGLSDTHIDFIPWIALHYRDHPGFRSFVDSLKDGYLGSPDLYARMTDPEAAYGTNVYRRASSS